MNASKPRYVLVESSSWFCIVSHPLSLQCFLIRATCREVSTL